MGRQINYYMETESFQRLTQKALDLGFIFIEQLSVGSENSSFHGECKEYQLLNTIDFSYKANYYFYLQEAGKIVLRNGFIDSDRSPVIAAGYSKIHENIISRNRIWVSTGYWDDYEIFSSRSDILDKKYSALARYVKRLAPYTEIPIRFQNGKIHVLKEYITPYLLNLINTTHYECVS